MTEENKSTDGQAQGGGALTAAGSANGSLFPTVSVEIQNQRSKTANCLILYSIFAVTAFVFYSIHSIDDTEKSLDYVRLAAHSIVSVAYIFFCYGLLRAGERMAIPTSLIRSPRDLRLLVGMKPPADELGKATSKVLDMSGKLVSQVGELAKPIIDAAREVKR